MMTLWKRVLCFCASVFVLIVLFNDVDMPLLSTKFATNESDIKYILVWKDWSMYKSYLRSLGRQRFVSKGCEENRCIITENRTEKPINSFDAILFHQRSFRWNDVPDPHLRNKNQRYIHWMHEAPMHLHFDKTSLKTMDNFFNWTFTYRRDSSIFSPYGAIKQVRSHPSGAALDSYISSFGANNSHLATSKNSTVPIAWFVSNCHSQSNREEFVKKLQKFMKVDVYGGCGPLDCPKTSNCLDMLEKRYYFYLSLENAVCEDYITEKFFSIAEYNIIPITLNGVEMSKFGPPNSYINVLDFQTVKDLADYLEMLIKDDKLYASYFWWKGFYSVSSGYLGYCNVCKALHEKTEDAINQERIKAPSNMYKWWVEDAHCYKPTFH